ncbi:MAG TPA: hypothetical protein VNI77_04025 [Nitrososphaera sp.]|nr:hypothetical protein [Nitrososphaera sp.]
MAFLEDSDIQLLGLNQQQQDCFAITGKRKASAWAYSMHYSNNSSQNGIGLDAAMRNIARCFNEIRQSLKKLRRLPESE